MALLPSGLLADSGSPLSTIPVYGTVAAGTYRGANGVNPILVRSGAFAGFFSVGTFAAQASQLLASGTLTGTLALVDSTGNAFPLQQVSQANAALPLTIGAGASCQSLHLALGPLDLDLLGLTIHLGQATLDITPQSAPGNRLGTPLCNIANLLSGNNPSLSAVAIQLQQLLQDLSAVSLLQNISLLGTTTTGSLLPGVFSVTSFGVDPNNLAQLEAVGTFSGLSPNGSSPAAPGTQPLTMPVTVDSSSSCQELHLTLGPLYQNLLGTIAAVSPVPLTVPAPPGAGNLLCGVAAQLGGGDLTGLAGLLNQIASALQGATTAPVGGTASKTVPVSLTASNGVKFTGNLTLTGFMTENNALFASGRLVGKLIGPAGNNAGQVNQPVQLIPVTPGAASCQNLALNLGPLDLNLVGLPVSLSATSLTITAPGGSGTSLGNLLCAVAGLLNQPPTNLQAVVGRLNQLLNFLA
jgi:hypothetical protein